MGLGLRRLARWLGLRWWLGLSRCWMLRRRLPRLGLGAGWLCGRCRDRRRIGDPLLYYPVPAYPAYYYYSYPAPAYYYYGVGSGGCCY